jgi:hypothetical protein
MKKVVWAGLVLALLVGGLFFSGVLKPHEERKLDLLNAAGQVSYRVFAGSDLTEARMELRNLTRAILIIRIPVGTVLTPSQPDTQTMGVIRETTVTLSPGETRRITLPVACLNMERNAPQEGTSFASVKPPMEELARLCTSPTFQGATFRVKQFAIWTLISRPKDRLDYTGLGLGREIVTALLSSGLSQDLLTRIARAPEEVFNLSSFQLSRLERALNSAGVPVNGATEIFALFFTGCPTSGELALVRRIFEEAGLSLDAYPSLRNL